jgi:NADH:ubiquinone oxidoreductase subunit E
MLGSPSPLRLLVCVGTCCDAQGKGSALLAALENALQADFPDELREERLVCLPRACLRVCTRDPVVRVEPSGDLFSNPSIDDLLRTVREAI